jgi:hypothetical protein
MLEEALNLDVQRPPIFSIEFRPRKKISAVWFAIVQ